MTLEVQFLTMMMMVGCGAVLGACFDTIGVSSREFRLHRALLALLDVAYWAAATVFVFRALLAANHGEVRLFVFIGLAIGVLLYALIIGSLYRKLLQGLIRVLKLVVRKTIAIIRVLLVRPLFFVYKLLVRLILAITGIVTTVSVFFAKLVLQWVEVMWQWIRARFRRQ